MRNNFSLKAYLVIGPENTDKKVEDVVREAIRGGFTFIQIRSKKASARELINLTKKVAKEIEKLGKEKEVALVVDDRLDIVLAAREEVEPR